MPNKLHSPLLQPAFKLGIVMNGLDLGTLLNMARRGGEVSYERLSKACGGSPTAKRLHQLENAPLKNFPDPGTIKALSRGTGFGVTEIVMASARSLNLPVTSDDPDMFRIYGLSTMPPRITDLFRDLGREIVELNQKQAPDEQVQVKPLPTDDSGLQPDAQGALVDEKMDSFDLAAYDTGEPVSMKRRQTDKQDIEAEESQDPDDHKRGMK